MTVQLIKAEKRKHFIAVHVLMTSSGGFESREITLPPSVWNDMGYEVPCEISTAEMDELYRYEEYYHCYEKALSILSYGDNSAAALKRKLKLKGFSDGAIVYASHAMKAHGYINDAELLNERVLYLANEKLHGRRRIVSELVAKGFLRHDIEAALERCEALISFPKNRKKLIMQRYGKTDGFTAEEIVKIKAFLYRNGY